MNDCGFDVKKWFDLKIRLVNFLKHKCHILTHDINAHRRIVSDFGLHKLIVMLL
jgi:hypothetical protein